MSPLVNQPKNGRDYLNRGVPSVIVLALIGYFLVYLNADTPGNPHFARDMTIGTLVWVVFVGLLIYVARRKYKYHEERSRQPRDN